ncbi:MAG: hypothetical protein EOO41_02785 [Methanobacteriota archaeon]|nr:MAG: hypothetical protein EOO41_02785 [Euryarchaeota archaeon]
MRTHAQARARARSTTVDVLLALPPRARARSVDGCRSANGQLLFVSSIDGYVSVLAFGAGELGTPLTPSTGLPAIMQRVHAPTFVPKDAAASVRKAAGAADADTDASAPGAGSVATALEADGTSPPAAAPAATINILQPRKRVATTLIAPLGSAASVTGATTTSALSQSSAPAYFPPASGDSAHLPAATPASAPVPPTSAIDMSGDSRSGMGGGEPGQKRRIVPTPVAPTAAADAPAKRQRVEDAAA